MEELCMRRLLEITTGAFGIIVPDTSLMNIKEGVSHRRMFMCISWTSFNQRILPKYNERTMCFIHRNGL
jgi:hypothetical protein